MTELRDIVPSRETCQILAEAGWQEETYFVWAHMQSDNGCDPYWYLGHKKSIPRRKALKVLPAPTAAELGEALPMYQEGEEYSLMCFPHRGGHVAAYVGAKSKTHPTARAIAPTEAEARAQLWLKLRESSAQRAEERTCGAGVQE